MNEEQMEAVRDLIEFARANAVEVYGSDKPTENPGSRESVVDILDAADLAEHYLDGDEDCTSSHGRGQQFCGECDPAV